MKHTDLQESAAEKTAYLDMNAVKKAVEAARGATPETTILGDQRTVVAKILQTSAGTETVAETPLAILAKAIKSAQTPYDQKLALIAAFNFEPHRAEIAVLFKAAVADPAGTTLQMKILEKSSPMTFPAEVILDIITSRSPDRKFQQAIVERIDGNEEINPDIQIQIIAALNTAKAIDNLLKAQRLRLVMRDPTNEGTLAPKQVLADLREEKDPQKRAALLTALNPSLDADPSTFMMLLAASNIPNDIIRLFVKYNFSLEKKPE